MLPSADKTWLTNHPINPLNVGQYVNNQSSGMSTTLSYVTILVILKYLPKVKDNEWFLLSYLNVYHYEAKISYLNNNNVADTEYFTPLRLSEQCCLPRGDITTVGDKRWGAESVTQPVVLHPTTRGFAPWPSPSTSCSHCHQGHSLRGGTSLRLLYGYLLKGLDGVQCSLIR